MMKWCRPAGAQNVLQHSSSTECISGSSINSIGRIHNSPHLPTSNPYSPRHMPGAQNSVVFNFPTSAGTNRTSSPDFGNRQRNSTASSGSQASSGFESMKSSSNPYVASHFASLRSDSPPNSRNSYHSSGSSSLGSLERLEETSFGGSNMHISISDLISTGKSNEDVIRSWLQSVNHPEYANLFIDSGYDMMTIAKMTPEDLTAIGITKPAHRKKLVTEIKKLNLPETSLRFQPSSVREWLSSEGLADYVIAFECQGQNLDRCRQLSWEDFEDLGVTKLGHQKKLSLAIKKLRESQHLKPVAQVEPTARLNGDYLVVNMPSTSAANGAKKSAEVKPFSHVPSQYANGMKSFTQQMAAINGDCSPSRQSPNTFVTYGDVHHQPETTMTHSAYDTLDINGVYQTKPVLEQKLSASLERPKLSVKPLQKFAPQTFRVDDRSLSAEKLKQELNDQSYRDSEGTNYAAQNYVNVMITQQFCNGNHAVANGGIKPYSATTNVFVNGMSHADCARLQQNPLLTTPSRLRKNCPPLPLRKPSNTCGSAVFQLSPPEKPTHPSISPAPSIEDFPPPPASLSCEQSIAKLKTLREQPPNSPLETPLAEIQDLITPTQTTFDTHPVGSFNSDSGLPFANENVGTIRQRSPRSANNYTDDFGLTSSYAALKAQNGQQTRKSVQNLFEDTKTSGQGSNPTIMLDEIGDMLQGLTDELDAMLTR